MKKSVGFIPLKKAGFERTKLPHCESGTCGIIDQVKAPLWDVEENESGIILKPKNKARK